VGATKAASAVTTHQAAQGVFQREGCSGPRRWGNAPGDTYGWHSHTFHKVLFCLEGSITFHTREGDIELHAGNRLDLEPGTEHAATVGSRGVSCVEASR
jgi:quercetin dioxygenase-like cupin family protein